MRGNGRNPEYAYWTSPERGSFGYRLQGVFPVGGPFRYTSPKLSARRFMRVLFLISAVIVFYRIPACLSRSNA